MDKIINLTDIKFITELINKSFATVALEFGYTKEEIPIFPAFIGPEIIESRINKGLKMFGYKYNNTIIGCCGYINYEGSYLIERLAVLPEYRHLGAGKKLLEFIEGKIRNSGSKKTALQVIEPNKVLVKWYENFGYKTIEKNKYPGIPFIVLTMEKNL